MNEETYYTDAYVESMHPRQAAIMREVPLEQRRAVIGRAHLLMNTTPGYIFSQALWQAKRDLDALGGDLDALEAMDRRDNHAAMQACGCAACARDLK
jgi:hypothetical protein